MSSILYVYLILFYCTLCLAGNGNAASCTHSLTATDSWQQVKSPGYPNPFPTQTQCSWRITAQNGFRIKLQFAGFTLVKPNDKGECTRQWLNIQFSDKNADSPSSFYTLCGADNPGTIVSPGNVVNLNLHSGSGSQGAKYTGFRVSYSSSDEVAALPGDLKQPSTPGPGERPIGPTRKTLGSVLNQLQPARGTKYGQKSLTQNERIELLNRRKNSGLPAPENPRYDTEGNMLGPNGQPITRRPAPKRNPTYAPPKKYVPRRHPKTISNEMKTVLIVVGLIVLAFVSLLVAVKLGLIRRLMDMRKRKRGEEQGMKAEKGGYVKKKGAKDDAKAGGAQKVTTETEGSHRSQHRKREAQTHGKTPGRSQRTGRAPEADDSKRKRPEKARHREVDVSTVSGRTENRERRSNAGKQEQQQKRTRANHGAREVGEQPSRRHPGRGERSERSRREHGAAKIERRRRRSPSPTSSEASASSSANNYRRHRR